jgi:hypothetical protein
MLIANRPVEPLVWGGDWNYAIHGRELCGSKEGRDAVLGATVELGLQVATGRLGHRVPELLAIDHIAVPSNWQVVEATRVVATADDLRLSDHDMYVVEVEPSGRRGTGPAAGRATRLGLKP